MLSGSCSGFCPWDVAAFILAAGIFVFIVIHHIKFKRKKKRLLQQIMKSEEEIPEEKKG